ncbi:MAG: hypothetical protein IPP66_19475 [Anaerolineales bacterium]|nr:hypothetical protein [Anaerolineales bacterium]
MENQVLVEEKPANKNRTLIIVVVAIIVLCCCCIVAAGAGYYFFRANGSTTVFPPTQPEDSVISSDGPPAGGLGNDILKNDTWNVIVPASIGLGCDQPLSSSSTIEVLQQPDANGVWFEKWTVVCASGDEYPFEVQYTLDATGASYNIKPLQ